ncbi:hypothetical protein [Alkalitalea saponilacus]|uniref:Polymerase/histidinol phosphatase N-terminal domain-containing protein n=1 Tax=Alkalitalea saponilacus TaxID=889453 RepID=A0A1T5ATF6_9BACT|nr:hypothetical protein [Alkalitalea saponilacus]ASB48599.1 hypothetical protein CDL62_05315 [Alkalitalea saponilacus]SKB38288.1 hypothetical protein SAMN03080601_00377 [Alkalitalea saponilacus]
MRSIILYLTLVGLLMFFSCSEQENRTFWSPYQDLNWSKIGHFDSEFHTHPGLGDEEYDPHQTIDRYKEEGYRILALAGHDYDIPSEHIQTIYPWTELSTIYETIKDIENPTEDNKTYGEMANEPFQNRDPVALNMVSIQGCEVSAPHHIVSLFNPLSEGAETEDETFQIIQELGGIAYFAHPGRYVERLGLTAEWYVDMYRKYDMLIGQSVFNREDRHPEDRPFYDKIVHILGADRPVWLYGEDDMHYEKTLGWNRDVILLESFEPGSMHPDIQNGSAPDVKIALQKGYSYLWKPSQQYNKRAFNIVDIEFGATSIQLSFDNENQVDEVRWLTHNPGTEETEAIHFGSSVSMSAVPSYARFVRAEIKGSAGTIYTQPFYVLSN